MFTKIMNVNVFIFIVRVRHAKIILHFSGKMVPFVKFLIFNLSYYMNIFNRIF